MLVDRWIESATCRRSVLLTAVAANVFLAVAFVCWSSVSPYYHQTVVSHCPPQILPICHLFSLVSTAKERYSWSPLRLHSLMTTHIILFLGSPLRCTVMCLGLGGGWWQAPYLQDMQDSQSWCSCWRWRDSACRSSTTSVVQTRQSISDTNLCRRGEAEG